MSVNNDRSELLGTFFQNSNELLTKEEAIKIAHQEMLRDLSQGIQKNGEAIAKIRDECKGIANDIEDVKRKMALNSKKITQLNRVACCLVFVILIIVGIVIFKRFG